MCMLLALCKLPRSGCLSSRHFFTHLTLFRVDCVHRINNLIQYALGNNKHLLYQLPRNDNWYSSHFFTHLTLFRVDCVHRINNLYTIRVGGTISVCNTNYRVAVGPLVGQGWERRRPTLS